MDSNKTLIALVLDRSGSMFGLKEHTIAAVNNFILEQRKLPGEASFLLVPFADLVLMPEGGAVPLATCALLGDGGHAYEPGGNTALLDAIGTTIDTIGLRLASLPEAERPGKVVVVVVTDGHENRSFIYRRARIKELITRQTEQYNWQFLFLLAGIDAIEVAESYGIPSRNTMSWDASPEGVGTVYLSVNSAVTRARTVGMDASFTAEDRVKNSSE